MSSDLEARARRMLAKRIAASGRYATVASDAFQAGDRDIFILASDAIGLAVDVAQGEWLPIEQAPKDGAEFQAWVRDTQSRAGRSWWEPRCRMNPESEAFEIWGRVDYDHDDWDVYPRIDATHFRPPPVPPRDAGIAP